MRLGFTDPALVVPLQPDVDDVSNSEVVQLVELNTRQRRRADLKVAADPQLTGHLADIRVLRPAPHRSSPVYIVVVRVKLFFHDH